MGKKRIGRCVKRNKNFNTEPESLVLAPHSFVIHRGLPGDNIFDLTKDFRKVMEPNTAISLKERKKNTIKDFVSIAGPLHVSHLCIFTRAEMGMYLKLCRLPRGPTLTFKLTNFSLSRDVISSLKKQLVFHDAFRNSPLLVLNNFGGEGNEIKLMATMFQNMFPTINLTNVDLNTIRRCVLISFDSTTKLVDFRHYVIKVVPVGISKGIKKVVQGKVPNLARCTDISEFLTTSTMLSESEMEDDPNSHVTLAQKLSSRGNIESGKSAIRLSELGPRLTMQLIKIEDGLLDGDVLYHELISKTEEEKEAIRKKREQKKKIKEKRKRVQEQNKKQKEATKQELKEKSLKGMQKNKPQPDTSVTTSEDVNAPAVDDDIQYYREEVGDEPDKDLFSRTQVGFKRPHKTIYSYKSKKAKLNEEHNVTEKKNNFRKKNNRPFKNKDVDETNSRNREHNRSFKNKGVDKTNSHNRDHRPIGSKSNYKFKK